MRVTLAGPDLEGLTVEAPAASVRLLLPSPGAREPVVPSWHGNEFLLPDGSRPIIRTFTPRRVDPAALEIDLRSSRTGRCASEWAATAEPGFAAAIAGPGRGYVIDPDATVFVLGGDETAIPAISQLLETLPHGSEVRVRIEIADPIAEIPLPEHPRATVEWSVLAPGAAPGDALVEALRDIDIPPDARLWAAGEAAAMQRIRKNWFDARGLPRSRAVVRGYWKHGRMADAVT